MALLAVFQPDPLSLAHLRRALGDEHEIVPFASWDALAEALELIPADGCLIDLYHSTGPVQLGAVQQLRLRHPALAIVVYAVFGGREMDLYTLGRYQIDGVLPADEGPSARQIQEAVTEALASSLAARVAGSLERHLSRLGIDCLRWAIENCHRGGSVEELAEPFARSSRALSRLLSREGSPPPGRLLMWGRLLRATHMMSARGISVESAAYAVGYSSGAALSRALVRETGYPPREVLLRGGIGCVLDGFVKREVRFPAARGAHWSAPARGFSRGPRGGGYP